MFQCGLDSIYPDFMPEVDTSIWIPSIFMVVGVFFLVSSICDCVWKCCRQCFDMYCCCYKLSGLYILTFYTALACIPMMFYEFNLGWTQWFPVAIVVILFMLPLIVVIFYGWCIVRGPIYRLWRKYECTILVDRSLMLQELKQRSDESTEKSTRPDYSDDDDETIQPYDRGPDGGCKKPNEANEREAEVR